MPYLVAHLLGPEQADGSRTPAPYTTHAKIDGELMHYVDFAALLSDPLPLGQIAALGHELESNDAIIEPTVDEVRVYSGLTQPPFSTLEEAKAAFGDAQAAEAEKTFVGDAVVDVLLKYHSQASLDHYRLSSNLNPDLPGQDVASSQVVYHRRRQTHSARL